MVTIKYQNNKFLIFGWIYSSQSSDDIQFVELRFYNSQNSQNSQASIQRKSYTNKVSIKYIKLNRLTISSAVGQLANLIPREILKTLFRLLFIA